MAAADGEPEVSVDPVITGSTVAGSTLIVDHGTWTGDGPLTYSVTWEACDTSAHRHEVAEGADTYVTTTDDVGSIVRAVVTVTDANDHSTVAWARTVQPIRAVDGPVADPLPAISGTAREGQMLSTTTGSWTGSGTLTYDYQWQRCDTLTEICSDIDGATGATYEAAADDIDSALRVAVTAEDEDEVATVALSAPTDTIVPAAPLARTAPVVTGTTETGSTLHAATGSWDGVAPITYTYQWRSCDLNGADCADISGATDDDYLLAEGDAGTTLRVTVTATNGDGSASKTSDATATVATAGGPEAAAPPTISGTEQEGSVLTAVAGSWTGDGTITYTYQWLLCGDDGTGCALIAGATGVDFTPTVDETFAILRVAVTAHDSAGSRMVLSDPTGVIAPAPGTGALANTVAPAISGDAADGAVLSAAHGTWTGGDAVTFEYRWRRCDADGRGCIPIDGASDAEIQLGTDDIGHRLRVSVTARSGTGSLTVLSAATDVVTRGLPEPPDELNVDGDAIEGSTASVDDGGWTGTDLEMTHQWQRCASDATGCIDIDGSTDASHLLVPDDVGHVLRVAVEAHSDLGSAEKLSTPTSVIAARAPVIDGTPYAWGVTLADGMLTADPGAWDGTPEITYTYQWQRCDDEGEDCADISGATASEYVLTGADVDNRVRVVVTATNVGGEASSASDPTDVIGAATPPILEGGSAPSISGDPHDGQPQTADPGWWSGVDPITFIYQWRRCDASGDDRADISGATAEEYDATSSDLGSTLRVHVRATNPSGSATSVSDPSPVITIAAPANVSPPSVSGEWSVGGELTVEDPGGWSGSMPFTYTFQWQRCDAYDELCDDLDGETSDTYTVTADDVRHVVRVLVTATNAHGDATSASYRAVINPARPENTALPEIHGTMRAGEVLSATTGTWDNPPDRYRYRWEHCNADGTFCFTLSGATSSTYATSMWDPGSTYRVTVTAANVDDWSPPTATSALTPPLASPSGPQNLTAPTLSTTAPVIGQAVTVSPGAWEGTGDISYSYSWYYCEGDEPTSCYRLWEASGDSWTPTYGYRDWRLRVEVAATDDEGYNSVSTAVSDPLVLGPAHNLTAPTLQGDAVISGMLTIDAGQWTGIERLDYAWERCDDEGESCVDIAGDEPSRELTADDLSHTLRARVIGSNSLGQETITTAPSEVVGHPTRPVAGSTPPSIWGDAVVGEQLSADDGTWTGNSGASSYRWLRCDTAGDPCTPIAGTTEAGYRVSRADAGAAIRVAVTHTNAAGATTVRSDATDAVPDPPAVANLMPPPPSGATPGRSRPTTPTRSWTIAASGPGCRTGCRSSGSAAIR